MLQVYQLFMLFVLCLPLANCSQPTPPATQPQSETATADTARQAAFATPNHALTLRLPDEKDFDTTTLQGKRDRLFALFAREQVADYDTLLDLNFDRKPDYIIGYTRQNGQRANKAARVYCFDAATQTYRLNEVLSNLANPSFLVHKKKITSFYIGLGGGHGSEFEWTGGKWVLSKEFDVNDEQQATVWVVHYLKTHKIEKIRLPFSALPPKAVLEVAFLP